LRNRPRTDHLQGRDADRSGVTPSDSVGDRPLSAVPSPLTPQQTEDVLGPLSNALWELRELLDLVCYLLTVQRLLATAGEARWLSYSAQQLDVATQQIRRTEIVRAGAADDAAAALGLKPAATLAEIAAAAPVPWDDILGEHRDALRTMAEKVAAARAATEQALRSGADAVTATLREMETSVRGDAARLDYRA
jgi:hypothetical protein